MNLATAFSHLLEARLNCIERQTNGDGWISKHTESIRKLEKSHLPSGSGIDAGSHLCLESSKPDKLVFTTSFHHMNDAGMYDGWTEHKVIVRPAFGGILIRVTGKDRNQVKDYLADVFSEALRIDI